MKLYELNRNTWVRLLEIPRVPPDAPEILKGDIVQYKQIDGMYAQCITEEDIVCYVPAWIEVEIVKPNPQQ